MLAMWTFLFIHQGLLTESRHGCFAQSTVSKSSPVSLSGPSKCKRVGEQTHAPAAQGPVLTPNTHGLATAVTVTYRGGYSRENKNVHSLV